MSQTEKWDASIQDTCIQVNRVLDMIAAAEPEWMAARSSMVS